MPDAPQGTRPGYDSAGNYVADVSPSFTGSTGTAGTPVSNTKPSTGTSSNTGGGTAWTSWINGDTFTGLGNLVSSFTGKGNGANNYYGTPPAPTSTASNNTIWIVGGFLAVCLLAYLFLKKGK